MRGHTAKDKRSEEGERYDEHVKEAIVAFSHAVPHPRAVMIKPLCRKREKKKKDMIINSLRYLQLSKSRMNESAHVVFQGTQPSNLQKAQDPLMTIPQAKELSL